MNHCTENAAGLVELGTATVETMGALGDIIEPMGLWRRAGISDD